MTPHQTLTVAVIGGVAALLGLVLLVLLALALYLLAARVLELYDAYRERRAHAREQAAELATLHAINALPTTRHPTDS
ncbi:hypothetical protein [Streptomyces sp. NPDC006132]|uniref:hypothetical protein n=1 Tax=Streptomyces sp. NPDC006132 TaxID=3156732 RepID=UPI0033FB9C61